MLVGPTRDGRLASSGVQRGSKNMAPRAILANVPYRPEQNTRCNSQAFDLGY